MTEAGTPGDSRHFEARFAQVMNRMENGPKAVRMVVIGASGSGKSTVAARVGAALSVQPLDLDVVYWRAEGEARAPSEAKALMAAATSGETWVVEGVWAELLEVALPKATTLVWLDLPWEACLEGLLQRGPHFGYDPADPDNLLALAIAHRDRLAGQAQVFRDFDRQRVRLRTRRAVANFSIDSLGQ